MSRTRLESISYAKGQERLPLEPTWTGRATGNETHKIVNSTLKTSG
ncbi:MAG: hypothetical protein ACI350_00210 [Prevotella sp.]